MNNNPNGRSCTWQCVADWHDYILVERCNGRYKCSTFDLWLAFSEAAFGRYPLWC